MEQWAALKLCEFQEATARETKVDGQEKAAVENGDVGEQLSAGVASCNGQLTRECRGVAVPSLWPLPHTPRGPNPQGGKGSHS